jgi:hypothetical protein
VGPRAGLDIEARGKILSPLINLRPKLNFADSIWCRLEYHKFKILNGATIKKI